MPVAFYSRQLRSSEKNYSSTELECLAVVAAIKHFECYLAGRRFELETDHRACPRSKGWIWRLPQQQP